MDKHDYIGEQPPAKVANTKPLTHKILKPLASLQLTIALFVISLLIVFFGTMAQKYDSLNTVLDNYFYCWVAWVDLNLLSDFTQVFFSFRFAGTEQDRVTCTVPFVGGFTLGWVMVVNLIAAHILRFKMSWKRSGIWILHAGMILLLVGEYVRANYALEDRMNLYEGQSSNYLFSLDRTEVVFLTSKDGINDEVISFPGDMVEKAAGKEPLSHPDLPFQLKVVQYMKNTTDVMPVVDPSTNLANAGVGQMLKLESAKEVSSIRGGGKINSPGCYVTLINVKDGKELGTYVLGYHIDNLQPVQHEGKEWRLAHRLKRTYLPYNVTAVSVERVNWPNSDKPKEYKTTVKVENTQTGESRDAVIEMNSPLRFAGSTFYQSSMDNMDDRKFTGFQVVRNPGSTIPYIACILITLGMAMHFLLKLQSFLILRGKTPAKAAKSDAVVVPANGSFKKNWLPAVIASSLAALFLVMVAKPSSPKEDKMDIDSFGKIPVLYQGRHMPIDTLARHHMLVMSGGRQSYKPTAKSESSEPALKYLLEVMSKKPKALDYPVIRIVDLDVLQYLRLDRRPGWWRYSWRETAAAFLPKLSEMNKLDKKIRSGKELTDFENSLRGTFRHLQDFKLMQELEFPGIFPDPEKPTEWLSVHEADLKNQAGFMEQAKVEAAAALRQKMKENPKFLEELAAEVGPEGLDDEIIRLNQEETKRSLDKLLKENRAQFAPQAAAFTRILDAYEADKVAEFNTAVRSYHETYVTQLPQESIRHTGKEYFLNHFDPFLWCQWLYVGVMLLAIFSWLGWGRPLNNAATALACVTVAVHTFALILRVIISEKPPVTNLYSSAVFIGWGCVVLGIGMDMYFRHGIANFVAGLTGMGTMLVARFLESSGDTMPRVEAVLNTSFWLSTHVTLVTLGYTATYVAGALGLVYVLGAMFTNAFRGDLGKTLYSMTYGTTCFATLLSFVGTVLGGFWADDSWGRFWGWDPKENGAVIIVIWNSLILHMRWSGMVKARGFAVMALLGISITTWSWFGTNQLGLGLHAYGFDKNLAQGCALCWIGVGLVALLGAVPSQFWASFGPEPTKDARHARRHKA